jgi:hypothetical protein
VGPTIDSTAWGVFTDLDGTLLDANQRLPPVNRSALEQLGKDQIWRIVVTGRSLFSARRVLDPHFPIDILVTSSGAGIFCFPDEQILHSAMMEERRVQESAVLLKQLALDFMIHAPLPDNHFFKWHRSASQNTDFCKRLEIYSGYHRPLPEDLTTIGPATQLLVVCPRDGDGRLHRTLQTALPDLTVIRTTSPLDHRSIWYEIFPSAISKASAAAWVCEHCGIDQHTALAIGNDYNDLDLLHWSSFSRVVANAPPDLQRQFAVVSDHNNNGFAEAVADWRHIISTQSSNHSPKQTALDK